MIALINLCGEYRARRARLMSALRLADFIDPADEGAAKHRQDLILQGHADIDAAWAAILAYKVSTWAELAAKADVIAEHLDHEQGSADEEEVGYEAAEILALDTLALETAAAGLKPESESLGKQVSSIEASQEREPSIPVDRGGARIFDRR